MAAVVQVASFEMPGDGTLAGGSYARSLRASASGAEICLDSWAFSSIGAAPAGCPSCTWSFTATTEATGTVSGTACAGKDYAWSSGDLDAAYGGITMAWGYAETYDVVDGSYTWTVDHAVFANPSGTDTGWVLWAYDYGATDHVSSYGTWVYAETAADPAISYTYYP
jgi:hypothetical protein